MHPQVVVTGSGVNVNGRGEIQGWLETPRSWYMSGLQLVRVKGDSWLRATLSLID